MPSPSSPFVLEPHDITVPFDRRAKTASPVEEIWVAPATPGTSVGTLLHGVANAPHVSAAA